MKFGIHVLFYLSLAFGFSQSVSTASAIGICWRTEHIPNDRLIENLKKKVDEKPNDANANYQLARAYIVAAYSNKIYRLYKVDGERVSSCKTGSFQFDGKWRTWNFWDSYNGSYGENSFPESAKDQIFWNNICRGSECKLALVHNKEALRKTALSNINQAIIYYQKAIKLKPSPLFKLGLGWALDVAGKTEQAKKVYRQVIRQAWPKERNKRWGTHGSVNYDSSLEDINYEMLRFATYEASFYLSAILDPKRNAKELKDLKKKLIRIARNKDSHGGDLTPVIVPIDRKSLLSKLTNPNLFVSFNLDGMGKKKWQWINPKAGLLVYVGNNKNPNITSGHQLFGNVTFHNFWTNGYEALASLDDDGDGWLRAQELAGIAIWQDKNSDGKSNKNELFSLKALGIKAIAVTHTGQNKNGWQNPVGIEYQNGEIGPSYDWISHKHVPITN